MREILALVEALEKGERLGEEDFFALLTHRDPQTDQRLRDGASRVRERIYGDTVFVRGLIEITNHCKNDCLYCGIRCSNSRAERYRLTEEQILACAHRGAEMGFSTFVLQGGEDPYFTDERLCRLVERLKETYPDKAVTLSLGERGRESYRRLRQAGADRYLLRHESADAAHYARLHPPKMRLETRMRALYDLRELGFQVGCGMMVESPYQTARHLAKDLAFIAHFQPEMCGIGPFIPHGETPFASYGAGSGALTCFLLALVRLSCPAVLLPATTALNTLDEGSRAKGMQWGANVVMPNLSPEDAKARYQLYHRKLSHGAEALEGLAQLKNEMNAIGRRVVMDRGDCKKKEV